MRSRYAIDSAGFRPASFISSASLCCLHSSAISAAISDRLVEKSDILEFAILQTDSRENCAILNSGADCDAALCRHGCSSQESN